MGTVFGIFVVVALVGLALWAHRHHVDIAALKSAQAAAKSEIAGAGAAVNAEVNKVTGA